MNHSITNSEITTDQYNQLLGAYIDLWNNVENGTIKENFFELRGQVRHFAHSNQDCESEFSASAKFCNDLTDKVWAGIERRIENGKHIDRDRLHSYIIESFDELHYLDASIPFHIKRDLGTKLEAAFDELTSYLLDNTDKVFEEIPEVDGARNSISDAQALLAKVTKQYVDVSLIPTFNDKGTEYVFTLPDGSEVYEIVIERGDFMQFYQMHNAVSGMPVSFKESKSS